MAVNRNTTRGRIQWMLILAVVAAVLYLVRDLFIPIACAILLTLLLTPVVSLLRRLRLGRVPAALSALVLAFVMVGTFVGLVGTELMDFASKLPDYQQSIRKKLEQVQGSQTVGGITRGVKAIKRELSNPTPAQPAKSGENTGTPANGGESAGPKPIPVQVVDTGENGWGTIDDFLTLLRPVGAAGIVLIFTAFILIKKEDVRDRLIKLTGIGRISVTTRALEDAEDRVGHYLRFALLINSGFGCFIAFGLFLIGIPNVALWGIIAGLMRFVPYAGILISCALPFLLSLAIFPGWLKPGLVLVVFFVPEAIVANVMEPLVYGANTGTSPLGLLVAAVFWTVLWGPIGLVLATPLTVCLVVLGRYVPQLSFLHVLLAEKPALADDARLYGRLLIADQNESKAIVDQMLKEEPLVELYDRLLIPALRLAEQDRHKGVLEAAQADAIFDGLKQIVAQIEERIGTQENDPVEPDPKSGQPHLRIKPSPDCSQQITSMAVMDEADEIAATMLAQALEYHNCPCTHISFGYEHEPRDADEIIFLSAVPPFAFVNARSYCARIRRQFPSSTIIVGMWGTSEEPEALKERFGSAKPDYVVTRFADALELVVEPRSGVLQP